MGRSLFNHTNHRRTQEEREEIYMSFFPFKGPCIGCILVLVYNKHVKIGKLLFFREIIRNILSEFTQADIQLKKKERKDLSDALLSHFWQPEREDPWPSFPDSLPSQNDQNSHFGAITTNTANLVTHYKLFHCATYSPLILCAAMCSWNAPSSCWRRVMNCFQHFYGSNLTYAKIK